MRNVSKSPSIGFGVAKGEKLDNTIDKEIQQEIRPRASSYGGGRKYARHKGVHADRQPFADYTLFPDKDPKVSNSQTVQVKY